jgi:hypothetical protein
MSVIDVTKMWSKTGGALSSERLSILDARWAITEGYQVLAEPGDTIDVIAAATGLPGLGDAHPTVTTTYVASVTPTPLGPAFWQVIIAYEGPPSNIGVDVEWTDTTTTEPIDRDLSGAAIVTANNEQVEGLTMDVADQVVVIRRQFLTIDTKSVAAYRRATNSDTYLGWPPGTARLIGFSAKNNFLYGTPNQQWDVTARIQFREPYANTTSAQAWYKRWRHEGLLILDGTVIRRATDELGQEVSKPVLLKTTGELETNPDAAIFNHTQVYGSIPYSGLGLI